MGMDVFGQNPSSDRGEYFRNNVWWWAPLWEYCCTVAPELCKSVSGYSNDGDGMNADDAEALTRVLNSELCEGRTAVYERAYNERISELPRHECKWCQGTGIRSDEVGVKNGMPTRALDQAIAVIVGRSHGWCNSCAGEGVVDDMRAMYSFSVENVAEFVDFLADCGGFKIL